MNNINLKDIKPQFMKQVILALRGDRAISQTVSDLRLRFGILDRSCNKADFYEICKSERIAVIDDFDMWATRGVYMWRRDNWRWRAIAICPKLSRRSWLKVAFHELGHHFLHRHRTTKHYLTERQPTLNRYITEAQANLFSDLMLLEVKSDEK